MRLLLLGKAFEWAPNPFYRGTERRQPDYPEAFPEQSEPVRAWNEYMETGGEDGVLTDISLAVVICDTYQRFLPEQRLEVVRAVGVGETDDAPGLGTLLGYDVSVGLCNSLLMGMPPPDHARPSITTSQE